MVLRSRERSTGHPFGPTRMPTKAVIVEHRRFVRDADQPARQRLASIRRRPSRSPMCATVCWITRRPMRKLRGSRQLPSFLRNVWRRSMPI